ncbi:Hypothetical_protein [Hexamita inflata]|uniref:Hypothetical_protein n=1 Tax=Hexamita inflata TaxID=28002 RepID=A0AA86TYD7_9EUKA|nr:Hypothetical protein HINF_LOCUS19382 [Hexamita inflata]CAI9959460.1 Hypothetical protein HINF_LOCUS47105 [Hexamita inflata]
MIIGTIDGQSYFSGALSAYLICNQFPFADLKQTKWAKYFIQYIPNNLLGTMIIYIVIILSFVTTNYFAMNDSWLIVKYVVQKLVFHSIIAFVFMLCLLDYSTGKNSMIENLSVLESDFIMISENVALIFSVLLDEIQIGPFKTIVIQMASIGILFVSIVCINIFTYCLKDIVQFLS